MSVKNMVSAVFPLLFICKVGCTQAPVIFNEIMSDPDPSVALPESEYVELCNTSDQEVSIEGWQYGDRVTSVSLHGTLPPHAYLLLVPIEAGFFFQGVQVVGLSSWPVLNNSSDQLILLNAARDTVDRIEYSNTWHDPEKQKGGWSLERNEGICLGGEWKSSVSPEGGTPGQPNSLADPPDDGLSPTLRYGYISGEKQIKLVFNEAVQITALRNSYIGDEAIESVLSGQKADTVYLITTHSLDPGVSYSLTLNKVVDCHGNEGMISCEILMPATPHRSQLRISEVLFDPYPGGVDFVELINPLQEPVLLEGINLSLYLEENGHWELKTRLPLRLGELIGKESYLFISTDPERVSNDYPLTTGDNGHKNALFNIPDTGGLLVLSQSDGILQDCVRVDSGWHHDWLRNAEGYSLERIDPTSDGLTNNNWSTCAKGATPGTRNTQAIEGALLSTIKVTPEVIYPQRLINSEARIRYSFKVPGSIAEVAIYDLEGRRINTLIDFDLIGTSGQILWDGTDRYGRVVSSGYYMVWFKVIRPDGQQEVIRKRIIVCYPCSP